METVFAAFVIVVSAMEASAQHENAEELRRILDKFESSMAWHDKFATRGHVVTRNEGFNDLGYWQYENVEYRDGALHEWIAEGSLYRDSDTMNPARKLSQRFVVGEDFFAETQKKDDGPNTGTIYDGATLSSPAVKKRMLAMDISFECGSFMRGRFQGVLGKQLLELVEEAEDVQLARELQSIDGSECAVLTVQTKFGTLQIWLAPDYGYSAQRIRLTRADSDFFDEQMLSEIGLDGWVAEINLSEFSKQKGSFVPMKGQLRQTMRHADGSERAILSEAQIASVNLTPSFIELNSFELVFPEGTILRYKSSPDLFYEFRSGVMTPIPQEAALGSTPTAVDE